MKTPPPKKPVSEEPARPPEPDKPKKRTPKAGTLDRVIHDKVEERVSDVRERLESRIKVLEAEKVAYQKMAGDEVERRQQIEQLRREWEEQQPDDLFRGREARQILRDAKPEVVTYRNKPTHLKLALKDIDRERVEAWLQRLHKGYSA